MPFTKRALPSLLAAAVAVLVLAMGAMAKGGHGRHHHASPVLQSSLAPSLTSDPTFHGVAPGGAPWVLKRGSVDIKKSGRLELAVKGLVIPNLGNPGPVTTIDASLYCGADSNTTPADTSKQVPISRKGNARIRDRSFDVPDTCLAPIVLVHPNGDLTRYIAVTGWRG